MADAELLECLQVDVAGLIDDAWAVAGAGRGRITPFLDLVRCSHCALRAAAGRFPSPATANSGRAARGPWHKLWCRGVLGLVRRALARRGGAEYSPWAVASRHLSQVQAFLDSSSGTSDCAAAWTAFVQKKVSRQRHP